MIKLVKQTFFSDTEVKEKMIEFIRDAEIFSMGAQCAGYEKKFAEKQGRAHALFVSSGSMANLVLVQALMNLGRLKKGDRVGVSSLTWATNVMPLIQLGLSPVLLDCEASNLNVSASIVRAAHERAPLRGLFLTNVLGLCADIDQVAAYCAEQNIIFFEDNCESLGTRAYGKLLGNFGVASTFSTFVAHHLSTIEGGMVCTDDDELQEMLLMVRAHGWDRNLSPEQKARRRAESGIDEFYALYSFYDLAYNARPTEIQGVIGSVEIEHWDEIVTRRHEQFGKLMAAVSANADVVQLTVGHIELVSSFAMPLILRTPELCAQYKAKFKNAGVEIRPIIAGNMSRQPFFKKYVADAPACPSADMVHECGFYFCNNAHLTSEEIAQLCALVKSA